MNGLALEYDPAGDRTAIRPERMLFHVLLLLRGKAVARDMMVGAVLGEPDGSPIRASVNGRTSCRKMTILPINTSSLSIGTPSVVRAPLSLTTMSGSV